jgi:hypothetical protein
MAFVEIYEFAIRLDNVEAREHTCSAFTAAAQRIDGLVAMRFLIAADDPGIMWQQIEWRDEAALKAGAKAYWKMPEMGLFSLFMLKPPVRIRNFVSA